MDNQQNRNRNSNLNRRYPFTDMRSIFLDGTNDLSSDNDTENTHNENPFSNFSFTQPINYSNEDLYRQNRVLSDQVRRLNESISSLYISSFNTNNMLNNIESILYNNRYFTPLRRNNRYPPFFRDDNLYNSLPSLMFCNCNLGSNPLLIICSAIKFKESKELKTSISFGFSSFNSDLF